MTCCRRRPTLCSVQGSALTALYNALFVGACKLHCRYSTHYCERLHTSRCAKVGAISHQCCCKSARVVQANASWYITLIMCQFWHIWLCKTRRVSIFKHPGLYENRTTYYGVAVALAIMILAAYVPWLQDNVFYTANPPGQCAWVPHLFFLVFCLAYTETTKWWARNNPDSFFTRRIIW